MPMSADDLRAHLVEAFPDADIAIEDLAGDGDHYRARIVSEVFRGMPRVRQHQTVYAALKGNGATARYVVLPKEDHGYRARESVGHTLYEMGAWLDRWMKPATTTGQE